MISAVNVIMVLDLSQKISLSFLQFAHGSPMSVVEKYHCFQEIEYQPLNNLLKNVVKLGEKLQEYISNGDNN